MKPLGILIYTVHTFDTSLQISQKMMEEIGSNNIILGKRVIGISQDNEIVTISCEDGSKYFAKHVITTTSGTAFISDHSVIQAKLSMCTYTQWLQPLRQPFLSSGHLYQLDDKVCTNKLFLVIS